MCVTNGSGDATDVARNRPLLVTFSSGKPLLYRSNDADARVAVTEKST